MNNFYDSTVIKPSIVLELVVRSEQQNLRLLLNDKERFNDKSDHIFYHIKILEKPFRIDIECDDTNLIKDISIDKLEIYPKFYEKTLDISKQDKSIVIFITKPFYSWYHQRMLGGWIMYDRSTYL